MPTDNNKSLIQSLLAANQEKEAVIQHLLRRREIDVFEVVDKMMALKRYQDVARPLIAEIVDTVCKIIEIDQEKENLGKRLSNKENRDAFVSAYTDQTIPFQIRAMREQKERQWTQEYLAQLTGMKQERISALENPNYGRYSLRILKQLASAFDVALIVRFVPFSELAEWKLNLSSNSLKVLSFEQEDYFKEKPEDKLGLEVWFHIQLEEIITHGIIRHVWHVKVPA